MKQNQNQHQKAFTLIELLVVIAIIALLAVLMIPTMSTVRDRALQVQCESNLHQIYAAFPVALAKPARQSKPFYPAIYEWPEIPQIAITNTTIFSCPADLSPEDEEGEPTKSLEDYALFLREENGGIYINFQLTDALPYRMVFDRGDYWEFWFEEGGCKDIHLGRSFVDFIFHVSKSKPHTVKYMVNSGDHDTPEVTDVVYKKQVVPGWENLSLRAKGDEFLVGSLGAPSDYALNASVASRENIAPGTILMLDYNMTTANHGEDMDEHLAAAARHMGKLNLIRADGSITTMGPSELNPLVYPEPW
ncbi:MAG: type II secretion system protein, partial [bacterium]|nr:type II secretion system protein [bacterium]